MNEYFEKELNNLLKKYEANNVLYEAFKYSLTVGGKRVRPMLILLMAKSLGKDYTKVIDIALAIELVHNYSLVHDDLPCMDNDMYRRGKLTTHAKYGEYIGVLVGDGLLTEAFNVISSSKTLENKSKIIEILSRNIGINGMILGQVLDMKNANKDIDIKTLELIHQTKTANLISACFETVLAEFNVENDKYITVANELGMVYQIQDDLMDFSNKDDKSNYVNIIGIEKTKEVLNEKILKIRNLLKDDKELLSYIEKIFIRKV
ncbi:polyprenyl synthetase family protein [Oceanivirga salmonicida]|uniref:polyprenyl synthetase family protein n=1 Tax=Oceanivirga salmonicida TaxID=1769291 RepID=UPI0008343672|nr:polyprenyl synthetase family protein [Oceanivirga salmonicida]